MCCHGDAGVSGGGMWGSQSPHETDWSHDPRRRGLETPINAHCKLQNLFFCNRDYILRAETKLCADIIGDIGYVNGSEMKRCFQASKA